MNSCPERQRILAYAQGKISPEQVDSIAEHVDACSDCQATLNSAAGADDTFITELVIAAHQPPLYSEPELERAAEVAAGRRGHGNHAAIERRPRPHGHRTPASRRAIAKVGNDLSRQ